MMDPFLDLVRKHRDGPAMPPLVACHGHQHHPEELLAAMGVDSINLLLGGSEEWQTRGMEYLTPTSCVYSRHAIGFFEAGMEAARLPVQLVLHTNFCSGDFHSGEVLGHFFGLNTVQFTIPYTVSPGSFAIAVKALRRLASQLATVSGAPLDVDRLREVLKVSNRLKSLHRDHAALPVTGMARLHDHYEVALAPWERKEPVIREILDRRREEVRAGDWNDDGPHIVLTGSPVLLGDGLGRIIEATGLRVRFFDFHFADQQGLRRIPEGPGDLPILGSIVDFSDPIQVLAAYHVELVSPERMVWGSTGMTHLDKRIEQLMRYNTLLDHDERLRGVIHHVLKFCDVYGTDRAAFKERVQNMTGMQVLDIERDFSMSSVGQLVTRLEAFKEVLDQST